MKWYQSGSTSSTFFRMGLLVVETFPPPLYHNEWFNAEVKHVQSLMNLAFGNGEALCGAWSCSSVKQHAVTDLHIIQVLPVQRSVQAEGKTLALVSMTVCPERATWRRGRRGSSSSL